MMERMIGQKIRQRIRTLVHNGTTAAAFSPAAVSKLAPTRDERLFLVLSIFIGVISGLLVVSFRVAIEWIKILTLGSAPHPGQYRLLFVPALAGLLVAALVQRFFPAARGSGVNQTKAALYIYNGYISFRTVIGKFITSAIAIGGGHSLGPEDPSLQIGAGVASIIARKLGLSRQKLRVFAPIGAAAGLAAAFNAPISAILFVIEEVIGQWSAAVLGSIVLSAISSVVVARRFWGSQPMFRIPAVTLRDNRELFAYAALGIIGGFFAFIFSRALGYLRPRLPPSTLDAVLPARRGWAAGRHDRFYRFSPGHGARLRGHGPCHARAIRLEVLAGACRIEIARHHPLIFEWNSRRHVRAHALHRSHAGRGRWLL